MNDRDDAQDVTHDAPVGARANPTALAVPDAARLLSAASGQRVTAEMIAFDVEAGAPQLFGDLHRRTRGIGADRHHRQRPHGPGRVADHHRQPFDAGGPAAKTAFIEQYLDVNKEGK